MDAERAVPAPRTGKALSSTAKSVVETRKTGPYACNAGRPTFKRAALNGILFVFKSGMRLYDLSIRPDTGRLLPLVGVIPPIHGVHCPPLRKPKIISRTRLRPEPHRSSFASTASSPRSPGTAPSTVAGSANTAGWSNGLTHSATTFAVFARALRVAPTFTKHSSNLVACTFSGTSSGVPAVLLKWPLITECLKPAFALSKRQ